MVKDFVVKIEKKNHKNLILDIQIGVDCREILD